MFETNDEIPRTRIKICGLKSLEHARFASGAFADFCGFIFYPKSPRYIKPEEAGAIISWLEGPKSVGVYVNEAIDEVNNSWPRRFAPSRFDLYKQQQSIRGASSGTNPMQEAQKK